MIDTITVESTILSSINVLSNDTDIEGLDSSSFKILSGGLTGNAVSVGKGIMNLDYSTITANGIDTVVYEVCDNYCICSIDSLIINYEISPGFMKINADTFKIVVGCVTDTFNIYENDIIPSTISNDSSFLITSLDSLEFINFYDSVFVFDYPGGVLEEGILSFEYQVCDTLGDCQVGIVRFEVEESDIALSVIDDTFKVDQADIGTLSILFNDDGYLDYSSIRLDGAFTGNFGASLELDTVTGIVMVDYTHDLSIVDSGGVDYFTYTVCDNYCVCAEAVVKLNVNPDPDLMKIYQAVSPNDDGDNDFWYINLIHLFPANKVTVFNRWGQVVYEVEGYNNADVRWEGLSNVDRFTIGTELPDGTYFYVIDLGHGIEHKTGYIVLNR